MKGILAGAGTAVAGAVLAAAAPHLFSDVIPGLWNKNSAAVEIDSRVDEASEADYSRASAHEVPLDAVDPQNWGNDDILPADVDLVKVGNASILVTVHNRRDHEVRITGMRGSLGETSPATSGTFFGYGPEGQASVKVIVDLGSDRKEAAVAFNDGTAGENYFPAQTEAIEPGHSLAFQVTVIPAPGLTAEYQLEIDVFDEGTTDTITLGDQQSGGPFVVSDFAPIYGSAFRWTGEDWDAADPRDICNAPRGDCSLVEQL